MFIRRLDLICWGVLLVGTFLQLTSHNVVEFKPAGRLVDACGRRLAVPPLVHDVLLFTPTIPDYLFTTRAPETLISGNDANRKIVSEGLLQQVYPQLKTARIFNRSSPGFSNLESIMVMAPDVIFDWDFRVAYFTQFGLPAGCLETRQRSPEDIFSNVRIYANTLGQEERADQLIDRFNAKLKTSIVSEQLAANRRRVLFVAINSAGAIYRDFWPLQSELLSSVGGTDVQMTLTRPSWLDMEEILRLDPDIIILQPHGIADEGPSPMQLMEAPVWRGLTAVKDRNIYAKPRGLSGYFTGIVETPLYARWLVELLHPSLPANLRSQLKTAYFRELGYTFNEDEIDALLAVDKNQVSRNHERFER